MRRLNSSTILLLLVACLTFAARPVRAQRHSLGSAPPTAPVLTPPHGSTPGGAPPPATVHNAPAGAGNHTSAAGLGGPIAAVSAGMGAIQFTAVNSSVPAPQTLTRQLSSEDERTRLGALSSLGVPGQYLTRGRVPQPHSMELDMLELGSTADLDAVLTVELDQHVVSAVLVPEGDSWKRVATLTFASSFSAGSTTPSSFVRPVRSWLEPGRYRAVYHASVNGSNGDFTENEVDLRVINGRAAVVMSFVSGARQCDEAGLARPPRQTCEMLQRWFEPDPTDPTHHFTLITGSGHFSAHEAADPLSASRNYRLTRLRSFACQPFIFSESAQHFEPTANSMPCAARDPATPQHASAERP